MSAQPTPEGMRRAAEVAAARVKPVSHLSFEELVQEAWVAVLSCVDTYDPEKAAGVPWEAYATRAGIFACRRLAWKATKDETWIGRTKEALERDPHEPERLPDDKLDVERWRAEVRAEVRQILADPAIDPDAIRLTLRHTTAADLAREKGQRPQKIINGSWEIRRRVKESAALKRLWKERP